MLCRKAMQEAGRKTRTCKKKWVGDPPWMDLCLLKIVLLHVVLRPLGIRLDKDFEAIPSNGKRTDTNEFPATIVVQLTTIWC